VRVPHPRGFVRELRLLRIAPRAHLLRELTLDLRELTLTGAIGATYY